MASPRGSRPWRFSLQFPGLVNRAGAVIPVQLQRSIYDQKVVGQSKYSSSLKRVQESSTGNGEGSTSFGSLILNAIALLSKTFFIEIDTPGAGTQSEHWTGNCLFSRLLLRGFLA